jgi:hypothetical protein
MPQRYPDPDRGHCWGTVFYCSFRNSWMPAKGLSVSPKPAIRSRPFKLSQGDCRPPCRRHPNVAVSSAVGRPRRWSAQEEMRRHNHCVHSPDLCCRFGQFFILARGTVPTRERLKIALPVGARGHCGPPRADVGVSNARGNRMFRKGNGPRSYRSASPLRFPRPDHRGTIRVLDLQPVTRRTRSVGRGQTLRHDAFKAHAASVLENHRAIVVGVVAEDDAESASAQQPRQAPLTVEERQMSNILPVQLKEVEGV